MHPSLTSLMPVEMLRGRGSTGEQEAPEEQHRELQVHQEQQELDTCAHLQGSGGTMGWILRAAGAGTVLWETQPGEVTCMDGWSSPGMDKEPAESSGVRQGRAR